MRILTDAEVTSIVSALEIEAATCAKLAGEMREQEQPRIAESLRDRAVRLTDLVAAFQEADTITLVD